MHIGSGRGPNPWEGLKEGLKKLGQSLVEWQKSHVVEKGSTDTAPRAKSLLSFHFWGFYYDLNTYLKPLGDYLIDRPSTERTADLFSLNLAPAETLSIIANFVNEGKNIDMSLFEGQGASLGLKRFADNIRRAKEAGADAAFDKAIENAKKVSDTDKQIILADAKILLSELENNVNSLLKDQIEDYEWEQAKTTVASPDAALVNSLNGLTFTDNLATIKATSADNLFKSKLPTENTLSNITQLANKGTNADDILLPYKSRIELKRIADNIRRAKEAGADAAFDKAIENAENLQKTDKQMIFADAKDLLDALEKQVNALLKETVQGYNWEPATCKVNSPDISLAGSLEQLILIPPFGGTDKPGAHILFRSASAEDILFNITYLANKGVSTNNILENSTRTTLLRLAKNIENAKAAGAYIAFNRCSELDPNEKKAFQDAKQLLIELETKVNSLLKEKSLPYEPKPIEGKTSLPKPEENLVNRLYTLAVEGSLRPTSQNLFRPNLNAEEILFSITQLADEEIDISKILPEDKSQIGLKRLASNLQRAKSENVAAALDNCIETAKLKKDLEKQRVFENAKQLLNALETSVNTLMEEQVEETERKAAKSTANLPSTTLADRLYNFNVSETAKVLSPEFNKDLLVFYKAQGTVEDNLMQMEKDLSRMTVFLEDENGHRYPLFDKLNDPYPGDGHPDAAGWNARRTKALLAFFENDQDALNSGYQYICQTIGGGYSSAAISSPHSSQKLNNGERFKPAMDKDSGTDIIENNIILKKKAGKIRSIEYTNEIKPEKVTTDSGLKDIDKDASHCKVRIELNFNENMKPTSCSGDIDFKIIVKGDERLKRSI